MSRSPRVGRARSAGPARAVVLGGAGFLGSHLCDALVAAGTSVVCVDNFCTGTPENVAQLVDRDDFSLVEWDVTEPPPPGVTDRLGDCDLVFHLASAASPPAYHRLPIETLRAGALGTENGLRLAERSGARFVLASTSEVYGDPSVHPQPEVYAGNVNPVGPRSVYDEAKRYAEALTSAYRRSRGVDTAIARIFNSYGPRMRPDDGRMVPSFVSQALGGRSLTVTGSGRQTRSICYVSDTVAGLLALAHSSEPGPVNLGNPLELSVLEIAAAVSEVVGGGSTVELVPAVEDDPQRRCPDITRAVQLLGWRPRVELAEGLRRTADWFADRRAADGSRGAPVLFPTGAGKGI